MRIRSIVVRNYRVHRELHVDLDPSRTLIAGPNESGKSTLIEAAHRAFFLRARTSGEAHRNMVSRLHSGHPEVEVLFEVSRKSYRIVKRFSGANGTATLTDMEGGMWTGENAESRLAELLGVDPGAAKGGAERAATQWAHLWIWQGGAGDDPTEHVNRECAALLARLQEAGGAALMQSEGDARVAEYFARRHDELFVRNGEPRAASPFARCLRDEELAREARAVAEIKLQRLGEAARDVQVADEIIADADRNLEQLQRDGAALNERAARVAVLRRAEEKANFAVTAAREKEEAFGASDERIRVMQVEQTRRAEAFAPSANETTRLSEAEAALRAGAVAAEEAYQRANRELREIRLRADFVAAHVAQSEKARDRDELEARLAQIRALRAGLAALEAAGAELPKAADETFRALLEAEKRCAKAAAALEAIATGIEIVASDRPVTAGARTLACGEALILAEETELKIGESIRIRIRPGGGRDLHQASKEFSAAGEALAEQLAAAGFASMPAFAEAHARRRNIEIEMQTIRARLEASGAATIESAIEAAALACRQAEDAVRNLATEAGEILLPPTLPEREALVRQMAALRRNAEASENVSSRARNEATGKLREAETELRRHRERVECERRALADLEAQRRLLVESLGDERQRAQVRAELRAKRLEAEQTLRSTRSALEELRPDELMREQANHAAALAKQRTRRIEAEQRRAVAWAELQRDGTTDPHADLAMAEARFAAARAQRATAERKAEAIRLLRQLFLAEQQQLADRFTRPLSAKISSYLECIFGPGAQAAMNLEANKFTALRLIRPDGALGACDFATLSGGTCEQVAAAVRLAMAELLAQAHDGSLPVVFDDAFGYADPERVRALQRMLELGASRGLQIIALTCNPADYAGFATKEITLGSAPAAGCDNGGRVKHAESAVVTKDELRGGVVRVEEEKNSPLGII
jgi:DNA repair exonuclease SbcCD ATPase subunit